MEGIAIAAVTVLAAVFVVALVRMIVVRGRRIRHLEARMGGLEHADELLTRVEAAPAGRRRRHLRALGLIPAAMLTAYRLTHRPAAAAALGLAALAGMGLFAAERPHSLDEVDPPAAADVPAAPKPNLSAPAPVQTPNARAQAPTVQIAASETAVPATTTTAPAAPPPTTTTTVAGPDTTVAVTTTTAGEDDCTDVLTLLRVGVSVC